MTVYVSKEQTAPVFLSLIHIFSLRAMRRKVTQNFVPARRASVYLLPAVAVNVPFAAARGSSPRGKKCA